MMQQSCIYKILYVNSVIDLVYFTFAVVFSPSARESCSNTVLTCEFHSRYQLEEKDIIVILKVLRLFPINQFVKFL